MALAVYLIRKYDETKTLEKKKQWIISLQSIVFLILTYLFIMNLAV